MGNNKQFRKSLADWYNSRKHWSQCKTNQEYLARHPELEYFDMPKTFYFRYLPDRPTIHWAIIVPKDNGYRARVTVYFINSYGRVFDKLEFKHAKIARRRLRKCGFDFSTNRYCPFTPMKPIYIQLSEGKKTAPYSKGNLFQSVQRDKKHIDKLEKAIIKQIAESYKLHLNWISRAKRTITVKSQKNAIKHQRNNIFVNAGIAIVKFIMNTLFFIIYVFIVVCIVSSISDFIRWLTQS